MRRVYLDGREEEIRGLVWGDLGVRILRDILAAGGDPHVYNYFQSGRGGTVLTSVSSPAPASGRGRAQSGRAQPEASPHPAQSALRVGPSG